MLNIPKHVAIIMDGNGRYAKALGKPRTFGHFKGVENVRNIAIQANNLGIKYLTLFAFSTENWSRPSEEVNYLMSLPAYFFDKFLKELMDNNIKINSIGDLEKFPNETRKVLLNAIEKTKENTGMVLSFAMNYGGRADIVSAVKKLIDSDISSEQVDDKVFEANLMTKDMPSVDLMIRTSGEYRISNFLLWQCAYAEFYFTDVYWPVFDSDCFIKAIESYNNRDRRFGGVK